MTFEAQINWNFQFPGADAAAARVPAIRRSGRVAYAVLTEGMQGRILASFRRCLYLESGRGELCCVGAEEIGIGPLNALIGEWQGARDAWGRPLSVGDTVTLEEGTLFAEGVPAFRLECERPWFPESAPSGWSRESLLRGIHYLSTVAADRARQEGLGRILSTVPVRRRLPDGFADSPIGRCAGPVVAALGDWLETALSGQAHDRAIPSEAAVLVGLGPGLTPSGDDFLGGILIALSELGEPVVQQDLSCWLMPLAATRTGTISRAHLACACLGEGSDALHSALAALLAGDIGRIEERLREIDGIGHSSGWDALAGAAFTCACWLHACDTRTASGMKQGVVPCR